MPIRPYLNGHSFDPDTIALFNAAYLAVCDELGLKDTATREVVAKRIIDLGQSARDPQQLSAAVIASFATESNLPWR